MNYCNIKKCDIANGVGVRVTLFVSGCTNHCEGCFQPETWDFNYGEPFTDATRNEIWRELDLPYIQGLTVLGGEPFEPENQRVLVGFLRETRRRFPDKNIWVFSGFRLDDEIMKEGAHPHCEVTDEMLSYIDMLVDGRFVLAQKDISLKFRGSKNQRIIDVNKSRAAGRIVLWDKIDTHGRDIHAG